MGGFSFSKVLISLNLRLNGNLNSGVPNKSGAIITLWWDVFSEINKHVGLNKGVECRWELFSKINKRVGSNKTM